MSKISRINEKTISKLKDDFSKSKRLLRNEDQPLRAGLSEILDLAEAVVSWPLFRCSFCQGTGDLPFEGDVDPPEWEGRLCHLCGGLGKVPKDHEAAFNPEELDLRKTVKTEIETDPAKLRRGLIVAYEKLVDASATVIKDYKNIPLNTPLTVEADLGNSIRVLLWGALKEVEAAREAFLAVPVERKNS